MSGYVESFIAESGITFTPSKRNIQAYQKASKKWSEIEATLDVGGNSIIMFCGAKNNGKSSLVRHLVNRYNSNLRKNEDCNGDDISFLDESDNTDPIDDLSNNRYAYYMDCDPGQPEMTTPGTIAAHIVRSRSQPLLSPTYLNVNQHEELIQSSVGGTNMSVDPRVYIENCRSVYRSIHEHRKNESSKSPIFINTMGHIRNVGLAMLIDLIKICRPTDLIVLNIENDSMRTIYADLSPEALDRAEASFYYETSRQSKGLKYACRIYNLDFSFADSSSVASRNRTALQLAYMAKIAESLPKSIMQLSPKWVLLDRVCICCIASYPIQKAIVLELFYHSWIHLVKIVKTTGNHEVHRDEANQNYAGNIIERVGENVMYGCGIVADIDMENKRLAIITPISQSTIDENVNCVLKPLSIQVPSGLFPRY